MLAEWLKPTHVGRIASRPAFSEADMQVDRAPTASAQLRTLALSRAADIHEPGKKRLLSDLRPPPPHRL
jgi:hypothetical protein